MEIYTYTQIKNYKIYVFTKKKVKGVKNEDKRNYLDKNDRVTLKTDSWTKG